MGHKNTMYWRKVRRQGKKVWVPRERPRVVWQLPPGVTLGDIDELVFPFLNRYQLFFTFTLAHDLAAMADGYLINGDL